MSSHRGGASRPTMTGVVVTRHDEQSVSSADVVVDGIAPMT